MKELKNRYQHIDIAKGIAIILVVLAHNRLLAHSHNSLLNNIILPFHIPFFFLISGVFFNESVSLKNTFYKKFNSLLMPYFFSLASVVILKFFIDNHLDINFLIYNLNTILYSTGKSLAHWAHLWFLTSLFTTIVFFKILQLYIFNRIKKTYIKSLLVILFLSVGYSIINGKLNIPVYHNLLINYGGLPWNIDLIAVTFFYMYAGFILRHSIKSDKINFIFNKYSTLFYLSVYIALLSNNHIDLNLRKLHYVTIDTIKALLGIFFTIGLSKIIAGSNLTNFKNYLSKLGQLSLIIYIFHYYIQFNAMKWLTYYGLLSPYSSAIISFAIGILSPIAIYFFIINKFTLLRKVYGTLIVP